MSADSLRSGGGSGNSGKGSHHNYHHHQQHQRSVSTIVRPQPVSEKTLMESVAGLINEVGLVGQPYSTNEEKESCIVWTKFIGKFPINACSSSGNSSSTATTTVNNDLKAAGVDSMLSIGDCSMQYSSSPPLLLMVGYPNGLQMWAIPLSGEAQEVLSWKRPSVRLCHLLPSPTTPVGHEPGKDEFQGVRPVIALVEGAHNGPNHLTFVSLRSGEILKSLKFIHSICDLIANSVQVVVSFLDKILILDPFNLETRVTISIACSSTSQTPTVNPVALGASWLAYSDHKLFPSLLSAGGVESSGPNSYTAQVLHAAKSLTKGLKGLGETVANSITGHRVPLAAELNPEPIVENGIVTIVNLTELKSGEFMMSESNGFSHSAVVAHFVAHMNGPLIALNFDPSGLLLVTADKGGHDFHVFRIHPHPLGSAMGAVHHLYVLHRGDTGAKVQDISFAPDSRWVAVSTLRGTTHIFPITPYGGGICVRTHTSHRVVNRLSRFHRTAGLDDSPTSGRNSPITTGSPSNPLSTTGNKSYDLLHLGSPYPNPRLPPFPHPLIVQPLAQLRQSFMVSSSPMSSPPIKSKGGSARGILPHEERIHVASIFEAPRGWLVNSPPIVPHCDKRKRAPVDAVFVMTCHGNLIEYFLEPITSTSIPKEKVSDDAPIELTVHARAQWSFPRPTFARELHPPLAPSNILLMSVQIPAPASATLNNCSNSNSEVHSNSTGETHRVQTNCSESDEGSDERWLSQVEITTHSGPHRRLWMGPQFTFKVFNPTVSASGNQTGVVDVETVEVNVTNRPAKSNPVNMPVSSSLLPVVIEASSGSSLEQSPRLIDPYCESEATASANESQIKEHLADAMMENCTVTSRNTGGCQSLGSCDDLSSCSFDSVSQHSADTPLVPSFCIEATLPFPD